MRSGVAALIFFSLATLCWSQAYTPYEREQVQAMLRDVADDVKKHYYDPNLHGIDWDAKVREAKEKIDKSDSLNKALSIVAATLDSLNDSHTFFLPPERPYMHDYGFQMQMIGDHCFIVRVRPGSDAETKGLKAGDELLRLNGYTPTRESFWRMEFLFEILRPQPGLRLSLRTVTGNERQVDVLARFRNLQAVKDFAINGVFPDFIRDMENQAHRLRVRYAEKGSDLLIVKLPEFYLSPSEVDSLVGKMRKHDAAILDLRGNPGGSEDTLRFLLGRIFENKVKIGDRVGRSSTRLIETEAHGHPFSGKLLILLDTKSDSASELFARIIQIEKRGLVLGDRSSGMVMEAKQYSHKVGVSTVVYYGASVSEADFRMPDGQSLEHVGVVPDKIILPTASDLANGRDPVLAQAAEMVNVKITPEEAGTFFPYEWTKE